MTTSFGGQAVDFGSDIDIGAGCAESGPWSSNWRYGDPKTNGSGQDRASLLVSLIEGEVIPRLLLAHSDNDPAGPSNTTETVARDAIPTETEFADLALRGDLSEVLDSIQSALNQGVKAEQVCLDLLAPVARLMGNYWVEDQWSFADVTLGLGRLHQVLHEISRYRSPSCRPGASVGRAFFAPVPGEQHSFGLVMVEEFFQRAGWTTASDPTATAAEIMHRLSSQSFDVVGFSVGCQQFLDPLSALVVETRKVSRNRDIMILVGGRVFQDDPSLIGRFQGVIVAPDGAEAVRLADKLLPHQTGAMSRVLM